MKKLCLILFSLYSSLSLASPEDLLSSAIQSEKSGGHSAFLNTLFPSTSAFSDESIIEDTKLFLSKADKKCGAIVDYSVLNQKKLSPKTEVGFFTVNYEKCPLYTMIITYRDKHNKEVISTFGFNFEPRSILPSSMLVTSP